MSSDSIPNRRCKDVYAQKDDCEGRQMHRRHRPMGRHLAVLSRACCLIRQHCVGASCMMMAGGGCCAPRFGARKKRGKTSAARCRRNSCNEIVRVDLGNADTLCRTLIRFDHARHLRRSEGREGCCLALTLPHVDGRDWKQLGGTCFKKCVWALPCLPPPNMVTL